MPWSVYYFPKVVKFVNKLSLKDRIRVKSAIESLEQYGPLLRQPIANKIGT